MFITVTVYQNFVKYFSKFHIHLGNADDLTKPCEPRGKCAKIRMYTYKGEKSLYAQLLMFHNGNRFKAPSSKESFVKNKSFQVINMKSDSFLFFSIY